MHRSPPLRNRRRPLRNRSSPKSARAKTLTSRAAAAGGPAASPAADRTTGRHAMKSAWVDHDAEAIVAHGAKTGVERDLALRVYTTRLLGRDPKLVLHGGGNTSLKTRARDLLGEDVEVLRVKASGADMAAIEPEGLPAVRLAPLRQLRALDAIADEELVAIERANLIDPAAPKSFRRNHAARVSAAQIHRSHPCDGGAQRDRPAATAKKNAPKFSAAGWHSCLTSCRASASPRRRSKSSSGASRATGSFSASTASSHSARARARPMSA